MGSPEGKKDYAPVPTSDSPLLDPKYEAAAVEHGALPSRPAGSKPPLPRGPFPLDIPILAQLKGKRVVLASASPRRKQILATIGLTNLEIIPSKLPEDLDKQKHSPFEYVLQTCNRKALDVYSGLIENSPVSIPDPALLMSADTVIVTNNGHILEKPRSELEHIKMLKMLRDQKSHRVFTAICAIAPREDARFPGYNIESEVVETKVIFDQNVGDDLIEAYVKTREGADKAGGYAVQGMGSLLIEKIEGSYDNVVGLPLRAMLAIIEKVVFDQVDPQDDGYEAFGGDN